MDIGDLFKGVQRDQSKELMAALRTSIGSNPEIRPLAQQLNDIPSIKNFLEVIALKKPIEEVLGFELTWSDFFEVLLIMHEAKG